MSPNHPLIRFVLYIVTIIVGAVAIVMGHVGPADWADALKELATYLSVLSGYAAASNISKPPTTLS